MTTVYEDLKGKTLAPYYAAFKSSATKENYTIMLRHFLNFSRLSPDEFVALARDSPKQAETAFISYAEQRKREVSGSPIMMAKDAVRLLLEMNDVDLGSINWGKIARVMPRVMHHASDRPPSPEEIRQFLFRVGFPLNVVILLLTSSGMRVGSLPYLRWQDIEPVEAQGYKFAKVKVYAGEPEEYTTFITPEAHKALLDYMKRRETRGERIGPNTPVIIHRMSEETLDKGGVVRPARPKTLSNQVGKMWNELGQRGMDQRGKRYDFKQVHGFRKFFKTTSERYMKSLYVEIFLGHSTGITNSYMKPSMEDMAAEYAKAIPALTMLAGDDRAMSREQTQALFSSQFLKMSGWTDEEIKALGIDLGTIDEGKIQELIAQKNNERLGASASGQKVVATSEVKDYLARGYEFVTKLDDKEAIVRLPR